jgi:hypothetical protein
MPTEGEGFDRLLRWFRQRRLLQVLAIYLGASWLILEITDVFIDKLALPPWFFPAAIVLLLIGLVVVVATAIIEGATVVAPAAELQARAPDVAAERRQRSMWTRALPPWPWCSLSQARSSRCSTGTTRRRSSTHR